VDERILKKRMYKILRNGIDIERCFFLKCLLRAEMGPLAQAPASQSGASPEV
jgi:hypothetical protein